LSSPAHIRVHRGRQIFFNAPSYLQSTLRTVLKQKFDELCVGIGANRKYLSNSCFDSRRPSSVRLIDFALLAGSLIRPWSWSRFSVSHSSVVMVAWLWHWIALEFGLCILSAAIGILAPTTFSTRARETTLLPTGRILWSMPIKFRAVRWALLELQRQGGYAFRC